MGHLEQAPDTLNTGAGDLQSRCRRIELHLQHRRPLSRLWRPTPSGAATPQCDHRDIVTGVDVDVETMIDHLALVGKTFDRVVFNFPQAMFQGGEHPEVMIEKNLFLMNSYFRNASQMVSPVGGKVHTSIVTSGYYVPWYDPWGLPYVGYINRLKLVKLAAFDVMDYPLYRPTREVNTNCDRPFPLYLA
ncbi:hypothetical protein OSB04_020892 [Centaurea solstitialis]|uniref:25S rRNA (uridine-N(3))-methyltransferase BMT5-like domain-containing protein n=1 Tax=Centaurea solstitialis TaxID=347529 RepID=A0AA38SUS5_9ASTR|nr:hypothetical protein OSB04_020892 [Centaurea solstitialis]